MDLDSMLQGEVASCAILVGEPLPAARAMAAKRLYDNEDAGAVLRELVPSRAYKLTVSTSAEADQRAVLARIPPFAAEHDLGFALYPGLAAPPEFRVAVMDMDSTLTGEEAIDEMAGLAGVREQVAKVTEAAMRGELDFEGALRARVALLAGQPATILADVLEHHTRATPGARELVRAFRSLGIQTAVVSGGFRPIVEPFADRLGLDQAFANELEIVDGKLTGAVTGPIVDGARKKATLLELCEGRRCGPDQAIAIGDGANDLPMIQAAGLGVAFCAKPKVRAGALAQVNRRRLDDVLFFLG